MSSIEGEIVKTGETEVVSQPTVYNLTILAKFIEAFHNGYNITEACQYAGVSRDSYYRWLEEIPEFAERIEEAKMMPNRKAKENVLKDIREGEVSTSKWWLERRDPEFKSKAELSTPPQLENTRQKIEGFLDDRDNDIQDNSAVIEAGSSEEPPSTT